MLDQTLLRKQPDLVSSQLARRGAEFPARDYDELEQQRKAIDSRYQALQTERNAVSRSIGDKMRQGHSLQQAREEAGIKSRQFENELESLSQQRTKVHAQLQQINLSLPNLPSPDTPDGVDENDNVVVSDWGKVPDFQFQARHHLELAGAGIDTEASSMLAGARFMVLRGQLAVLHRALGTFMLDLHGSEHGYEECCVPYIANTESLTGTGQLPKFSDDLFALNDPPDQYLIPTAEVPLTNLYRNRLFATADLQQPLRLMAHTPCFRREAGSYGRDVRGIIRQHQFDKVELVNIATSAQAQQCLTEICNCAETVLRRLQLPYRKVQLCAGDLGFAAQKTYDLEVWMPSSKNFREISSCSHFGDFQARRLKIRWRNPATGKTEFLHTLNGSGLAVGRCLAAIIENGQCADGSIEIPAALHPWTKGITRLAAS